MDFPVLLLPASQIGTRADARLWSFGVLEGGFIFVLALQRESADDCRAAAAVIRTNGVSGALAILGGSLDIVWCSEHESICLSLFTLLSCVFYYLFTRCVFQTITTIITTVTTKLASSISY